MVLRHKHSLVVVTPTPRSRIEAIINSMGTRALAGVGLGLPLFPLRYHYLPFVFGGSSGIVEWRQEDRRTLTGRALRVSHGFHARQHIPPPGAN